MSSLNQLVEQFVNEIAAAVEIQAMSRARDAVEAALGGRQARRSNGWQAPPALAQIVNGNGLAKGKTNAVGRPRKKPPIQLCPVPGCTGKAAPIFGMVCAKHKDVSKTLIKKYREARRAKKLSAKGGPGKGARKRAGKPARAARGATARKQTGNKRGAARQAPAAATASA